MLHGNIEEKTPSFWNLRVSGQHKGQGKLLLLSVGGDQGVEQACVRGQCLLLRSVSV